MRHVDGELVRECRQAEVSLSCTWAAGPGQEWDGEPREAYTSEGEELARECAAIAMLPSPPRAQECWRLNRSGAFKTVHSLHYCKWSLALFIEINRDGACDRSETTYSSIHEGQ